MNASIATPSLEERIIKSKVKLQKISPFFAVLLMNAKYAVVDYIPTMATDGSSILINENFSQKLSDSELTGVLLHEVMHMALCHVSRTKSLPEKLLANVACDIVVNGILRDNSIDLPSGAVYDDSLKHLSVREIYEILSKKADEMKKKYEGTGMCLQGNGNEDGEGASGSGEELEQAWADVIRQAETVSKMKNAGPKGLGIKRLFDELNSPQVNWRDKLYRFITQTLYDFTSFDRRFLYQGMYLDSLGGESLELDLFVDTSGSVSKEELNSLLSEVRGALMAADKVRANLFFFDTRLYDMGEVGLENMEFEPMGGGGTSFGPMIRYLKEKSVSTIAICCTDGYACLELDEPDCKIIWAVTPGGQKSEKFRFGEVIRLGEG
jgi:predicted metal-dependent peptidase